VNDSFERTKNLEDRDLLLRLEAIADALSEVAEAESRPDFWEILCRNIGLVVPGQRTMALEVLKDGRFACPYRIGPEGGLFDGVGGVEVPEGFEKRHGLWLLDPAEVPRKDPVWRWLLGDDLNAEIGPLMVVMVPGQVDSAGALVVRTAKGFAVLRSTRALLRIIAVQGGAVLQGAGGLNRGGSSSVEASEVVSDRPFDAQQQAAFQSGVAEMATTVLHNVGNTLVGLTTRAQGIATGAQDILQVSDLLDDVPGLVAEELARGGDPKERLTYLLAVLEEVAQVLREAVTGRIEEDARALSIAVTHVSELVQVQQRSVSPDRGATRFTLEGLVGDVMTMLDPIVTGRGVRLEKFLTVEVRDVFLPRNQLLQAVINLIKNGAEAIFERRKRMYHDGCISISVEPAPGSMLRLIVRDDGCGFAAEDRDAMFRFGFSTKRIGSGYGLHATANFVQSIGGEILAESAGHDCGAAFTLVLPCSVRSDGA
jgi:signal transduction histidine kinase